MVAAGVLFLVLHAWTAWDLFAGLRGVASLGKKAIPRDHAVVVAAAFYESVAAWVLLGATLLVAAIFARPPRGRGALPWGRIGIAAGALALAVAIPVQPRILLRFMPQAGAPTWHERACTFAGMLSIPAMLFVAAVGLSLAIGRKRHTPERREALRRDLVHGGLLLLLCAVLMFLRLVLQLADEAAVLGPRFPGWGTMFPHALAAAWPVHAVAFAGALALSFGAVHLRKAER